MFPGSFGFDSEAFLVCAKLFDEFVRGVLDVFDGAFGGGCEGVGTDAEDRVELFDDACVICVVVEGDDDSSVASLDVLDAAVFKCFVDVGDECSFEEWPIFSFDGNFCVVDDNSVEMHGCRGCAFRTIVLSL